MDAALIVEDRVALLSEPLPEIKTGPVALTKSPYGADDVLARVEVSNPGPEPLDDPRVEVVCYDNTKKIVGGDLTFPGVIPPSGKVLVELRPITSVKPDTCVAFAVHSLF